MFSQLQDYHTHEFIASVVTRLDQYQVNHPPSTYSMGPHEPRCTAEEIVRLDGCLEKGNQISLGFQTLIH